MLSVVIRTKNEEKDLEFLLKNLTSRYIEDINEIIVIDNMSIDNSKNVCLQYNAKYIQIENFSYGGSANLAAESAKNDIVVIFSAHSYPVSHDFFKLIIQKFKAQSNLAGLRCIHYNRDYKLYINGFDASFDYNGAGLMFACSAFNKKVWENIPFKHDITTYEDKEWTKRVLEKGYKVEIVPSIFCYHIKRNQRQKYFRFKNDTIGGYQLFHNQYTFLGTFKNFINELINLFSKSLIDFFYIIKRFFFMLRFLTNKPKQF
jgi:glycosyltransferase involved in cell wall biosynthesis